MKSIIDFYQFQLENKISEQTFGGRGVSRKRRNANILQGSIDSSFAKSEDSSTIQVAEDSNVCLVNYGVARQKPTRRTRG